MRKLASVQVIEEVNKHPNADALDIVKVLGWRCVAKLGEFKVGDKVIYCEVDSVLPEKPEFEFLRPKKFRIKTIRLRQEISQGICFPMSFLPEGNYEIDQDVTELLGVVKYEIPEPQHNPNSVGGCPKGNFPGFLQKTDETRIQSCFKKLEPYINECVMYGMEKIDGSSVTFYVRDGEFGCCSRNLELKEDEKNVIWRMAKKYNLKEKMLAFNQNLALQGELIGPGIQGNKYKLKEPEVRFFSLFDINKFSYLGFHDWLELCTEFEIPIVPVLFYDKILKLDVDGLVKLSQGPSELNKDIPREGIVIRSMLATEVPHFGYLSFKVINPEFEIKY